MGIHRVMLIQSVLKSVQMLIFGELIGNLDSLHFARFKCIYCGVCNSMWHGVSESSQASSSAKRLGQESEKTKSVNVETPATLNHFELDANSDLSSSFDAFVSEAAARRFWCVCFQRIQYRCRWLMKPISFNFTDTKNAKKLISQCRLSKWVNNHELVIVSETWYLARGEIPRQPHPALSMWHGSLIMGSIN